MKFISTRKGLVANGPESVFQGLAPDGGLYLPESLGSKKIESLDDLKDMGQAERFVLDVFFDDFPKEVREEAIARLLARFPQEDAVPLVKKGDLFYLELFHGSTGAFKDVALSMLPVFMRYSASGRKVLVLTATSGDTGSAAMHGFAGVEGTKIIVFYPADGVSRIQRLQMTTPSEANVRAVGIRGNFDDAQSAVKRIFADKSMAELASSKSVTLSSANSINTGRLIPQIAYYVLAGARLDKEFDVVVPSGNFGNILAAWYAKQLGTPIRKLVVASNVNDVLARFVKTGIYEPGARFTVTNSPSMDIRLSSNVERLLWALNFNGDTHQACAETSRLMADFAANGKYELNDEAKKRLFAEFDSGVATEEETLSEMRRVREETGYVIDPHTAVSSFVARKLGLGKDGIPCVVAATATAYKFPETCEMAFGEVPEGKRPKSFENLETLDVVQKGICDIAEIDDEVEAFM